MSLDLNKLANKLDEALSNETSETLTKFLTDKRMSNNKSSVSSLIAEIQRRVAIIQSEPQTMARELMIDNLSVDLEQYEAMHKEERAESYADGYSQGYKRGVDYMAWKNTNEVQVIKNESNN